MGDIKSECCFKNIEKLHNEMQFLMKLRLDYEVFRANILNRGKTPDMDSILGELLREETHIFTPALLVEKKESNSVNFYQQREGTTTRFL